MRRRALGFGLILALALLAWWAASLQGTGVQAGELRRLSWYRVERLPADLPAAWRAELEQALAAAPEVELLGPDALPAAARVLRGLSWVDPDSVATRLRLPEGIEIDFEPRVLGVAVLDRGRLVPLSRDGVVLSPGLPRELLALLAVVRAEEDGALPEVGRRVADPLLQEALRAVFEFDAVRTALNGDLVAIERQPGYPRGADGVPPALAFVTRGGCRLHWGRTAVSRDPGGIPAALKLDRLARVLAFRPALAGLRHVVLDGPRVHLVDAGGAELALPASLR